MLCLQRLLAERKDFLEFCRRKLRQPTLARPNHTRGNLFLALDHLVNFLFQRSHAEKFVNLNPARLADAKGTVGGLVFYGRVPPAVKVKDVGGARQVQAGPARFQRKDEEVGRFRMILETVDHHIPLLLGHASVQEERFLSKRLLEMTLEYLTHLRELGEDERSVSRREHFLHHLDQTRQLSGAVREGRIVAQKLRRVVTNLFELGERSQHHALPLDPLGGLQGLRGFFYHGGIKRTLLFGQGAEDLHFHLFRQVRNDGLVRFQAPQDKRPGKLMQALHCLRVTLRLNGNEERLLEFGLRAQQSGIEKLHDGPQVTDVVFHRGARQRDAIIRFESARGA